jgi:hypothetical protein
MNPTLLCPESELAFFAARYQYPLQETAVLDLRKAIVERGWMTKDELRIIAQWKAPRSARHMENNPEEYVKEITAFALSAKTERSRIEVLTNLDGVCDPSFLSSGTIPHNGLSSTVVGISARTSSVYFRFLVALCTVLPKSIKAH